MKRILKSLCALRDLYRVPSAHQLAQRELEEAQRELLKAQSGREYADAMVTYQQRRVARLQGYVDAMPQAANEATLTPNQAALRRAA